MGAALASNLIKYLELLAGITGIICYYRTPKSIWLVFAAFLISLYGLEELGSWMGRNKMYEENTHLYKWIVIPALFVMYHIVYFSITIKKLRPIVLASGILFLLLAIFENLFLKDEHFFSISLTLSYGCLSVLLLSLFYFFQLIKSEEILYFKRLMPFWFCVALLIFYLGSFPYLTFFNSMSISKNRETAAIYRWIFIALNWIMYILFSIGFICSKPKSEPL
jgi:hypothetical protein